MIHTLTATILLAVVQDFDQALEQGDQRLEEAKALYESAKLRGSLEGFNDAAFKLEEARVKFLAVQELATGEKQKAAGERLRNAQQLARLIADGRKAVSTPAVPLPADAPPSKPSEPVPPAAPAPRADVRPARWPIPDASEQRKAELTVRNFFKDDYSRKDTAGRKSLAKSLLEQAIRREDAPAVLWVLGREAMDVAASAGDVEVAFQASDFLSSAFEVGGLTMKLGALASAGKAAKAPDDLRALGERYLQLAEDAAAAEDYPQAEQAAQQAVSAAKRAGDAEAAALAGTRAKQIAELRSISASAYRARAVLLSKDASDGAACLEFGRYLCLIRNDWGRGLAFLGKGADPVLKVLAGKEQAKPSAAADLVALGDGWWDAAEKEKLAPFKSGSRARARHHYEAARGLATGLTKAHVERRLEEAARAALPPPIDLLRLVDPARDTAAGSWVRSGAALSSTVKRGNARLAFPYQPPEEYDLSLVVTRHEGEGSIYVKLHAGSVGFWFYLDAWSRTISGIGLLEGRTPDVNETRVNGAFLKDGRPSTILCAVRRESLTVSIDGRKILEYKGSWSRLSEGENLRMPDPRALGLGYHEGRVTLLKATLTPLSGSGQKLR